MTLTGLKSKLHTSQTEMDSDQLDKAERLRTLREKCKLMTIQEMQALAQVFKRRTGSLSEELKVLQEHLTTRLAAVDELRRRHP
jgi:hypothetical protein